MSIGDLWLPRLLCLSTIHLGVRHEQDLSGVYACTHYQSTDLHLLHIKMEKFWSQRTRQDRKENEIASISLLLSVASRLRMHYNNIIIGTKLFFLPQASNSYFCNTRVCSQVSFTIRHCNTWLTQLCSDLKKVHDILQNVHWQGYTHKHSRLVHI